MTFASMWSAWQQAEPLDVAVLTFVGCLMAVLALDTACGWIWRKVHRQSEDWIAEGNVRQ